jgi:peptide/nickel transport system substrate-binding protein
VVASSKGETLSKKRLLSGVALLAVLTLVAAACGGTKKTPGTSGNVKAGGTLRLETDGFEWTDAFDPTGEYLGTAFGIYSDLLGRGLTGYNHVSGTAGNQLIGDLATEPTGNPSSDGKTYTYTLRDGIKFGDPVNRVITSKDVAYAFQRLATKSLVAQYGFYYEPAIKGFKDFEDGKASTISGIETPDDKTIKFTLNQPVGDFPYLLAMPAAMPIPQEVAKCWTKAGEYGRYVVSSGPYEIEGADKLDITSCKSQKPLTGFDPADHLRLVRNPSYDPATDTKTARENFFDKWDMELNTNSQNIFDKVQAGSLETEEATVLPAVLSKYLSDPTLKDLLKVNPGDRTWYLTMNLTTPPFDDINVRKAANFILDKDALIKALGGATSGKAAEHIIPPEVLNGKLPQGEFDPYGCSGGSNCPNHSGDLADALAAMKKSKYKTDASGKCIDPKCQNVSAVTRSTAGFTVLEPAITASMAKIGIQLKTTEVQSFYGKAGVPKNQVQFTEGAGWGKDYADAKTFFGALFLGSAILPEGNVNLSLVGLTPDIAKSVGLPASIANNVPSIQSDYDACDVKSGDDRVNCWADLDKKVMTAIVPWIPYRWATARFTIGPAVSKWEFDQFSGEPAWCHMAVDTTKQTQ